MLNRIILEFFKFLLLVILFSGCTSLELLEKKPEVKFKDIVLRGLTFQSIDLDVTYDVVNPYSFEFLLNSIVYALKIEGTQVLTSSLTLEKVIPPNQTSPLNMRLHLTYETIGKIFKELLSKKQVEAHLDGQVKLGFPKDLSLPQSLDVPFVYDKKLELVL
jgi:LEA14-like dessication related protein